MDEDEFDDTPAGKTLVVPVSAVAPWSRALIVDLCLTPDKLGAVLAKHGLTLAEFAAIQSNPAFKIEMDEVRAATAKSGHTFQQKVQSIADGALPNMASLMESEYTPPAVRADLFKHITKLAGYEPKNGAGAGSGFSLVINLGEKGVTIEGEVMDGE